MFLLILKIYEIFQYFAYGILRLFPRTDKRTRFLQLRDSGNFLACVAEASEKFALIKKQNQKAQIFWFHVASGGELEQAIPIARCFHEQLNASIFLTYYSPSAEPFIKNFPGLLMATGLPLDSMHSYEKAFASLPFSKIFFVRYDIWPALVQFASQNHVELNLLCATRRNTKTGLIANLGQKFRLFLLKKFKFIFVVAEDEVAYFQNLLPNQRVIYAGDSKWWRAKERAEKFRNLRLDPAVKPRDDTTQLRGDLTKSQDNFLYFFEFVESHIKRHNLKCVVFGSPHEAEHEIALQCVDMNAKVLIVYVPHDVSQEGCAKLSRQIQEKGGTPCFYSQISKSDATFPSNFNVIIVDTIGHLAELYALGELAVVGGGFDGQIHNILEPCAHGVPTLIGPNFQRAPEAQTLVAKQGALSFPTPNLLYQFLSRWGNLGETMEQLRIVHEHAMELFKSIPNTNQNILKPFLEKNLRENLQENKL